MQPAIGQCSHERLLTLAKFHGVSIFAGITQCSTPSQVSYARCCPRKFARAHPASCSLRTWTVLHRRMWPAFVNGLQRQLTASAPRSNQRPKKLKRRWDLIPHIGLHFSEHWLCMTASSSTYDGGAGVVKINITTSSGAQVIMSLLPRYIHDFAGISCK